MFEHRRTWTHGSSVTDAILGALTLPDIGQFFPDTDPRWKGANSEVFLEEARKKMDERGYQLSNLDVTLILQALYPFSAFQQSFETSACVLVCRPAFVLPWACARCTRMQVRESDKAKSRV